AYTDEISDIDVLVCYDPFEKLDIARLRKLKWIQLSSIGIDQVPKEKVKASGIAVTNNRSGYSIPIGEWIVMSMLQLLKNSKTLFSRQDEKLWKIDTSILELYNKTVCFIGTGSIATEAAKRLQGFGARIIGLNTTGRNAEYFESCYPIKDLEQVLSQADIVVVSVPGTQETHHLINTKNIGALKKGACLINIARGSIVEEAALLEALKRGDLRGAALDVFEEEPLPADNPLWSMENVIITPHNSWISEMRNERRYNIIYENLRRYILGEKLMNIVNVERGY
ncbi:MAG TPA: phosphoglycerate dehydrogenase, partial [Negativicutes bacterium]|nr:phosphoglycerate dehydrogenase [Negativicutes bacterium]